MSELKARNSSELKAFAASELLAFGLGSKDLFLQPPKTDIAMTWNVEFVHQNVGGSIISTQQGTVLFNDRMFHVLFHLLGTTNNRGQCDVTPLDMRTYSAGTPEPINGLHNDGNLTIHTVSQVPLVGFFWGGGVSIAGDGGGAIIGGGPSLVDTGSAIELRGFAQIDVGSQGTQSIEGIYAHDPNVLLGFPHIPNSVPDWIMIYFSGAGGMTVEGSPSTPTKRVFCRWKCVISLP